MGLRGETYYMVSNVSQESSPHLWTKTRQPWRAFGVGVAIVVVEVALAVVVVVFLVGLR